MASRSAIIDAFLAAAGWEGAARLALAGDASPRSYSRLTLAGDTAILMDAPPAAGNDVGVFVKVAGHLQGLGLSAPQVLANDNEAGLLLLEDLGDALFARVLEHQPAVQPDLYAAATDLLIALQASPPWQGCRVWDTGHLVGLIDEILDWLPLKGPGAKEAISAGVETVLTALPPARPAMALRDYHAENLIWLPGRVGLARVGLLDFQDAFAGHPVYDLVSLLSDARRDVPDDLRDETLTRFARAKAMNTGEVRHAAAAIGAQRSLRILGVFFRLARRDGKRGYLRFVPRVWGHVQRDLTHPALDPLKAVLDRGLAPPTENLVATPCPTAPTA